MIVIFMEYTLLMRYIQIYWLLPTGLLKEISIIAWIWLNWLWNFEVQWNPSRASAHFLNEHFMCQQTAAGLQQNLKQAVFKFYWQLVLVIFVNRIFLLCITALFYYSVPSKNNLLALITFTEIYDLMLIQWWGSSTQNVSEPVINCFWHCYSVFYLAGSISTWKW